MKTATKDFIHARGMNSDVNTINMLMREATNIIEATEVYEGAYRLKFESGESRLINEDEMKWLRDYVQECTEIDFYIKMLDGSIKTAVV